MDDKCIGCVLSADANDGTIYQGKLTAVDMHNGSLTLASVFKNGMPMNCCVTLNANDLSHLRVIRTAPTSSMPSVAAASSKSSLSASSTAPTVKNQRPLKKPVDISLSSASSSSEKPTEHLKVLLPPKSTKGSKNHQPAIPAPEKKLATNVEKLFEAVGKSPAVKQNSRHSKRQSPEKKENGFTHVTEEISATPHFKSFEPQVPQPKILSSMVPNGSSGSSSRPCSRKQGPSGNPVLDALNQYKGIGRRNQKNGLAEPIDFDLDSDFDFAENLKLFSREDDDDEYYETVEKLKVSQNFAHFENIVDDVERVTSWTNLKAKSSENAKTMRMEKKASKQFGVVTFEKTMDGGPIPAISAADKKEYLKDCKESMGEAVFDTIIADRLFQWICEIQLGHGDSSGTVVLLASASNSVRSIRRLLTHFDKRRYNCHLFGKYPGEEFDYVNVVSDIKMLPREAPIICVLTQDINEDVESWLRIQHNAAHFVCVEYLPAVLDPARCHLLQFGAATNGLRHAGIPKTPKVQRGAMTFEMLCGKDVEGTETVLVDSAIADLGSPSHWFDESTSKFISTAFATSFLVRLSNE